MADPQDSIEIAGVSPPAAAEPARPEPRRKWLSVWFNCCKSYGRMYINRQGTGYRGQCPRCGATVRARVGPGGTSRRMFETR